MPMAEAASMPPDVLEAVGEIEAHVGFCPNIIRTLALASGCFPSLYRLLNDVNTRQRLSRRHREIIVLYTARTTGGRYEWIQHEPLARGAGLGALEIDALRRLDIDAECFSPADKVVLRYAEEIGARGKATSETFLALRERFSPQEIMELMLNLGIYRMLSEITENAETPLDSPFSDVLLDRVLEEQRGLPDTSALEP